MDNSDSISEKKVWCNCCDEPHDERNCSVALVRSIREDRFEDERQTESKI